MKKNYLSIPCLMAATSLFFSCNKSPLPVVEEPEPQAQMQAAPGGMMVISVMPNNGSSDTKVMAADDPESNINSLQVFVFYGASDSALGQVEGKRETDKYFTYSDAKSDRAETVTTTIGAKRIYAIANAPRISGVDTETTLKAKTLSLGYNVVEGGNLKGLVMVGASGYESTDAEINVQAQNVPISAYSAQSGDASVTTVPIKLNRLAARIELQNLKVNFSDTELEGINFTLKEVYLKNVPNTVFLTGQNASLLGTETNWSNRISLDGSLASEIKSLIYSSFNDVLSNTGADYTVRQSFYCYPNNTTNDRTDNIWGPRRTRIVIHGELSGSNSYGVNYSTPKQSYYPFSIAAPENFVTSDSTTPATNTHPTHISIVGNHKYVINSITITSEGKPDDTNDGVLISGRAKINVSVQDWNGTSVMNYEI